MLQKLKVLMLIKINFYCFIIDKMTGIIKFLNSGISTGPRIGIGSTTAILGPQADQ